MSIEYSSLPFDVRKNLKSLNIHNGNYETYNRYHKKEMKAIWNFFSPKCDIPEVFINQDLEDCERFFYFFQNNYPLEYKVCSCIKNCDIARRKRLKKRVKDFVTYSLENDKKALFLSLTFTNDFLNTTTFETRRRYLTRWLKENCLKYVANIDYGEEKGREHYHAIVVVDGKLDYTSWVGGACNGEKIRVNKNSTEECFKKNTGKLANYINKLVNHGLKDSTNNNKIIYSRN